MMPAGSILLLSDARGVYIPRDFINEVRPECLSGVKEGDRMILEKGPDHEWYWEAWDAVLNDARVTDHSTGIVYTVHQDGDCWLVPVGAEWPEEDM
jgi:hypothetical protein